MVDEAHRHERLTAAHAVPSAAIEDCLDAGLDMIIHCSMTEATGAYVYRPALADRMAETGVWVNPTMHDIRAWLWYYRDEEAAGRSLMRRRSRVGTSSGGYTTTSWMPSAGSTPLAWS